MSIPLEGVGEVWRGLGGSRLREGVSPTRGAKIVDLRPVPATYQTSRAKKRKPPPGPSIKNRSPPGDFRFPLRKGTPPFVSSLPMKA